MKVAIYTLTRDRLEYTRHCFRTLREKALDLVDRGESTLEEVLRVTRSEALDIGDPTGGGAEATS